MGGTTRASRRSTTNGPTFASPGRWTPRSAISRNSSRRSCEATACRRPRGPRWSDQSLHIGTAHQFPNFAPDLPAERQRQDLAAGLGVVVFDGPQGRGFYKGGHDGQTANSFVCLERGPSLRPDPGQRRPRRSAFRRPGAVHPRRHRRAVRLGIRRSGRQIVTVRIVCATCVSSARILRLRSRGRGSVSGT